ncbi:MAG TPA: antibiotic biosynthesis monooxygenase [Ktedonobacteraceae bacterium]|nr:antibiotic biosynthesis monooxygenase [Ktedonobacteraceae bacterium]
MATYILVFGRVHQLDDKEAFESAFYEVSRMVVQNARGIIRDELIHDSDDPHAYIMLSEWESKEAWAEWQRAPVHEEQVGGMKKYWKGQGVRICNTAFIVEKAGT